MSASDVAHKIERVLARDPVLRDVLTRTLPKSVRPLKFTPDVDVVELDDCFLLVLDVPGVARDTLSVELDGAKLVVEGNKSLRHPGGGKIKVGERTDGKFKREFLLPAHVNGDAVTARLEDGVLTIQVPRMTASRSVHVDVD
jgi:HSP20 family molecular chaperone IbpA